MRVCSGGAGGVACGAATQRVACNSRLRISHVAPVQSRPVHACQLATGVSNTQLSQRQHVVQPIQHPCKRRPSSCLRAWGDSSSSSERETSPQSRTVSNRVTTLPPTAQPISETSSSWWGALPSRFKLLIATSFSFVLCNMDKVNMSVCIIPMAMDFGWSPTVSGTVQASFFYGYLLCQLPGGYLASKLGGRKLLPAGVVLWSGMTCATPLLAATIPGLCVARAGVGLGESVAPSAAVDMIARVVPQNERSRAVSFVFGGLHVGSIIGLLAAPALIHAFDWPSVFIVFGAAGLVWALWYEGMLGQLGAQDPDFLDRLNMGGGSSSHGAALTSGTFGNEPLLAGGDNRADAAWYGRSVTPESEDQGGGGHGGALDPAMAVPYRAFFRSGPVQALCFTHFCHNWFHYTMLAWLPTYFTSTLSVDLMHAAQTALFPPLAGIAVSAMAGPLADNLIGRGMPIPHVRKLAQGASFLGPCLFLLLASSDLVEGNRTATVACITAALGMSSFSLAGMYCTHQDMSPRYCAPLLGLTNTVGAIPGIIGVATVGYLYDATQSWQDSLFLPSALCMVAGAYTYCMHASNEPIDFDRLDNSPFAFERFIPRLPSWVRLPWANKDADE